LDLIIPKIHHQDSEEDLEKEIQGDQEDQEDHQEEVTTQEITIQEDWIQIWPH